MGQRNQVSGAVHSYYGRHPLNNLKRGSRLIAAMLVQDLAQQQATYRSLIARNRNRPMDALVQAGGGQLTALPLPFVLIQVQCTKHLCITPRAATGDAPTGCLLCRLTRMQLWRSKSQRTTGWHTLILKGTLYF